MSRCSFVKTFFGVMSLFVLFFSVSIPVEARDYHIQASDGEVYTVTLGEEPGVENFSFRDANGEILRCVTEDERTVATELYFAAKFFWNTLPWYRPENEFEDWEASVSVIAKDALNKLGQRQIATMVAQYSVTMSLIIAQPNLFVPGAADVISNINGAIAGELERAVLLDASFLARTAGRGAVKHESILRGLWSSYETRSVVIPIDEINDAWESHYKASLYLALASRLVSQYLQVPNFEERISTFLRSIAPFANKVETLASITYSNEHLQDLRALRENSIAGIHRESRFLVYLGKRRSRSELAEAGFFQPVVDTPLEDIRIAIDDDPQRLDVRDYFSPKSDNLLYVPRADDENIAVARTETIGSSIIITPQNIGRTSVEVTVVGPRDLRVTDSFMVSVVQDTQQVQRPEPYETIDHQLLLIDGSPRTLNIAPYFSWDNPLDFEVSASPPGIVAASVSGSRVTLTPRQLGNASVVVRAYDRNDRSLSTIQTIPVLVYTDRATIVRPATPATFTPPATSNPAVEGLRKGVSVITQLDPGFTLSIRTQPRRNSDIVDRLGSGATGTLIGGPRKNGGFTWWRIRWDASGLEGWSVEADRGQILFRRPPDLEIRDLDVSDDDVKLGESFTLEAEVYNNGPGESAATEIYFYYSRNRHSSLEALNRDGNLRVAGRGTVAVPSLREGRSRKVSVTAEAPADPDTYYYGALLRSNILETDYTEDLDPDFLRNNFAREVGVEVKSSPDLIVESISTNRAILDPGEGFTLRATVGNKGTGVPGRNALLRYYRSSNAHISTRDTEVGSDSASSSNLGTNGIGEESINLTAPSEPGVYYYGACVELTDEERSDNNCSGAVSITVRETGVSDLVVSLPTLSHHTIGPGESFTLETTVRNQGDGTASPTTLRGYQSDNTSISSNDTEIGSVEVSSLTAGATEIQQFSLTAPLAAGTYYYGMVVDGMENESNTANNRSTSVALMVENRPPVVSKSFPPQTLDVGEGVVVDVSEYFSDPNEDILTYYVFSDAASVVVAEFSDVSNSELVLTPLAAGTATITVEVSDGEFTATQTVDVSVTGSSVSEEAWMPDANLRAAVRETLGLTPNEALTQQAMQGLTILRYWGYINNNKEIADLTGLESATNLTELGLGGNQIVDVTPLANLNNLTILDLNGNQIVDAMPLTNLNNLTRLDLDNNQIVDVTPLTNLKNLTELDLDDNQIIGVTPLANLNNLTTLYLSGNQIVDITPLANLKDLTWLDLDDNQIVDVTPLTNLKNLTRLDLQSNQIVDVTPLTNLNNLTALALGGNQIVDVTPLANLNNLTELGLHSNQVVDATPLTNLKDLTWLFLVGNPIADLAPLRRLKAENPNIRIDIDIGAGTAAVSEEIWMPDTNLRTKVREALGLAPGDVLTQEAMRGLTELDASLTWDADASLKIKNLAGLEHATQLTTLDLRHNAISNVSPLSGMTQLTTLDLGDNEIVDVSPLSGMTQLTTLYLWSNAITDVSPLSGMTQLTTLSLNNNAITDVSPLSAMTQLTRLYLSNNAIADVSPLSAMTKLTLLNLGRNAIADVSPLSGLTQLTRLYLGSNEIVDVSPLSGLTQLTWLDLGPNEIVDVSPLSGLTQLTTLDLYDNEIVDISALSGLTHLTELYLNSNEIADVSALEGLINLERLELEENPISDFAPLRRLKAKNPDVEIDIDINAETPVISGGGAALHVYWTLFDRGEIQRSNLDGTGVRTLFTKLTHPMDIAVDIAGGKIYWSTFSPDKNKIQRANLDGTNIQDIVTNELLGPAGIHPLLNPVDWVYIALDVAGGKIYWTNDGDDKIQRANLDGSNVEDIVTEGLSSLNGITLDVRRKKIYWTNLYKIQRANLDGSNVQDIFVNSRRYILYGIALDVTGGKVYWGNLFERKIQRANLDGSNVEDIVTGVETDNVALDVAGGKIYWTNNDGDKIQRANLDGSNVEDIVTGVNAIEIALGTFSQDPPPVVREDVNRDGVIDLQDTTVVRANLGQTGQNDADVNGDNVVDVDDLVLVLAAIENAAAAPTAHTQIQQLFTTEEVQQWVTEAQLSEDTSPAYLKGVTMLEQILVLLIPQETALLANYPNPFNPETWIPYQLSKPVDVTVSIYSVDGKLVRTLVLGHQTAGVYQGKSRAAYWDGRNNVGERVASGIYFYTFTAGDFTATRKMLIRK